jgi:uncharacterized NAD-dependent epimerase/dehydratase family protein
MKEQEIRALCEKYATQAGMAVYDIVQATLEAVNRDLGLTEEDEQYLEIDEIE